jgi:hypothetical protein
MGWFGWKEDDWYLRESHGLAEWMKCGYWTGTINGYRSASTGLALLGSLLLVSYLVPSLSIYHDIHTPHTPIRAKSRLVPTPGIYLYLDSTAMIPSPFSWPYNPTPLPSPAHLFTTYLHPIQTLSHFFGLPRRSISHPLPHTSSSS